MVSSVPNQQMCQRHGHCERRLAICLTIPSTGQRMESEVPRASIGGLGMLSACKEIGQEVGRDLMIREHLAHRLLGSSERGEGMLLRYCADGDQYL